MPSISAQFLVQREEFRSDCSFCTLVQVQLALTSVLVLVLMSGVLELVLRLPPHRLHTGEPHGCC
jgi:hypothetical protein